MIKIEIIGDNAIEVQKKLIELAGMVDASQDDAPQAEAMTLQQMIESIREQGYEVTLPKVIADEIVEREAKKARRSKKEEHVVEEPQETVVWEDPAPEENDAPVSSVTEADTSDEVVDLEAFKDQTIARLEALYFEDGGAQTVNAIRQKFKVTRKKFRDLPASLFPQIAEELSKTLGQ